MVTFIFTQYAKRTFLDLPHLIQKRITKKLRSLKNHLNIFSLLQNLQDFEPATHRLRIGNYRLILELKSRSEQEIHFFVLKIGHRREIYR